MLATEGATIEAYEANWRIRLLGAISNPEIVLLLGLIGLYGLMYEGWNPGADRSGRRWRYLPVARRLRIAGAAG